MKEILIFIKFILFLVRIHFVQNKLFQNHVNIFDLIEEQQLKFSKVEEIVKEYLQMPQQYISSHNNKENFIAIFSNFTKLNGEVLLNEYIENMNGKDLQSIIDNINQIKNKYVTRWEFDTQKGKFILPDDSKIPY